MPFFIEHQQTLIKHSETAPITAHAYYVLLKWGMSYQQIRKLQKIVGEFAGFYGRCPEKIASIKTIYLNQQRNRLIIPNFPRLWNILGQLCAGDCRNISDLLITKLSASNLIAMINTSRQSDSLQINLAVGHNRTHFRAGYGTHVWTGLKQSGRPDEDMIVLDASYQHISHLKTNGYRLIKTQNYHEVEEPSTTTLCLADIEIQPDGIRVYSTPDAATVGLSQDTSVSFDLGFAAFNHQTIPFIWATSAIPVHAAIFLLNPYSGRTDVTYRYGKPFRLTSSAQEEIASILQTANQIQFEILK